MYDFLLLINYIGEIDPSGLFVLSLFPYLIFLYYAQKINLIPKLSLLGFQLTILFVFITIIFAIIAMKFYNKDLTDVDTLHGAAEAFLTLSDALIALGFLQVLQSKQVNNS